MKTKLLLVDDETEFADALAERLKIRQFNVTVAYSGQAALDILADKEADVVVLDIAMPGMDGIETLKRIREIAPGTQIVLLTGHATVDNAIKGMKNGAFDFLLKPVDLSSLVKKITAAARIKQAHDDRISKAKIEHIVASRGW